MRKFRVIVPFALVAAILLVAPISVPSEPGVRTFAIQAQQLEFMPDKIEVNQGDHVVITLIASDGIRGFHLDGYNISRELMPGNAQKIEFVADQVGKFHYRCSEVCGSLDPFLTGEFVVEPNVPYWRAAGCIVALLAGLLAYLWQFKGAVVEH